MKKLIYMLVLLPVLAAAQQTDYFKRLYSNGYLELFTSVIELAPNDYMTCGFSQDFFGGIQKAYVLRIGKKGDTIWTRLIGDTIYSYDAYHLCKIPGDAAHMMLTGLERKQDSTHASGFTRDWYLMKMDTAGNESWRKTYQFENRYNYPYKVIPTYDGGFMIMGDTRDKDNTRTDFYIIKTDSEGNLQWQKKHDIGTLPDDRPNDIVETPDHGYLVCGWSRGYQGSDYIGDVAVVKLDSAGNLKWKKFYGEADRYDAGNAIIAASDGNYIVGGSKEVRSLGPNYFDSWVFKIDPAGEIIWQKILIRGKASHPIKMLELADQSIMAVGYVASNHPKAGDNGFLFKLSANGDSLWAREYGSPYVENKPFPPDYIYDFAATSDKGFILCGSAHDFTQSGTTSADGWLVKLDSLGCLEPGCELDVGIQQIVLPGKGLLLYPNPFSDMLTMELPAPAIKHTSLSVTDILGKTVYSQSLQEGDQQLLLETSSWPEGLYQVRILQDGKLLYTEKLIRME